MLRHIPKTLRLIAILSLGMNLLYAFIVPHYEASDELYHYPMVQYLATHGLSLPPQDPAQPGPWRQEGSQPPLYYLMAAVLTAPIPQDDLAQVRRENPLAVVGQAPPDGGINLMVHSGDVPTDGAFAATRISRIFSAILGALTVAVTFYTAQTLFPDRPEWAWGAAAFNAVLPMFAFISGSVNNDNLSNLLGNLTILLLIRLVLMETRPRLGWYVALGVCVGMGILSKLSMGFAIPVVALVLMLLSFRFRDWRPLILGGLISGGLTILIAGWWYLRNFQLYGDPTGLNRFLEMVGERPVPLDLTGVLSESAGFNQTFWGLFGGVNVVMPDLFYTVCHILTVLGVTGAILFWVVGLIRFQRPARWWIASGISAGWIIVTILACVRWTSITPASQGRLAFVALSSIALWFLVGLTALIPLRVREIVIKTGVGMLGIVAILTPFTVIAPVYALPPAIADAPATHVWKESNGHGSFALTAHSDLPTIGEPDSYVRFSADFKVINRVSADYALFVHLLTPSGVIVAQRDVLPAQGLVMTSDLDAGWAWRNPIAVYLPPTLHTGKTLEVHVGWFNLTTGERVKRLGGQETVKIGTISIPSQVSADDIPNPIDVRYNFGASLIGYQVKRLVVGQADSFDLQLVWQAHRPIPHDYTLTVQLIDPDTFHKAASVDLYQATSTWVVGEAWVQPLTLAIAPDTPPGQYALRVGWYVQDEAGNFVMQPVLPSYQTSQTLTPMQVVPFAVQ